MLGEASTAAAVVEVFTGVAQVPREVVEASTEAAPEALAHPRHVQAVGHSTARQAHLGPPAPGRTQDRAATVFGPEAHRLMSTSVGPHLHPELACTRSRTVRCIHSVVP